MDETTIESSDDLFGFNFIERDSRFGWMGQGSLGAGGIRNWENKTGGRSSTSILARWGRFFWYATYVLTLVSRTTRVLETRSWIERPFELNAMKAMSSIRNRSEIM